MHCENKADANLATRAYFDSISVESRLIDAAIPSLDYTLFGQTFSTPIMMAALSHLHGKGGEGDGMVEMAIAAHKLNCVMWAGMGDTIQLEHILETGAKTIKIIKPYADECEVLTRMEHAENHGALAVGMDIDHAFDHAGRADNVLGCAMRPRTQAEIAAYVKRTKLPFVIKGVLSVQDAIKCRDAGVQGIVVSHHHGILPYAVPPLYILPKIAAAVGGDMEIFLDCGVERGMDVFKALALGANAVSVGRAVMEPLKQDGAEGICAFVETLNDELRAALARTASPTPRSIDPTVLARIE